MDLRLPMPDVSWAWRIAFVGGFTLGPILAAEVFDYGWGSSPLLSMTGGLTVGGLYWWQQRRQRQRRGAGWYPTPGEVGVLRWWDGERWSEQRAVKAKHS